MAEISSVQLYRNNDGCCVMVISFAKILISSCIPFEILINNHSSVKTISVVFQEFIPKASLIGFWWTWIWCWHGLDLSEICGFSVMFRMSNWLMYWIYKRYPSDTYWITLTLDDLSFESSLTWLEFKGHHFPSGLFIILKKWKTFRISF